MSIVGLRNKCSFKFPLNEIQIFKRMKTNKTQTLFYNILRFEAMIQSMHIMGRQCTLSGNEKVHTNSVFNRSVMRVRIGAICLRF